MSALLGYGLMIVSLIFVAAAAWGVHMYLVQSDPRWFLTIFFSPIFALVTFLVGLDVRTWR